MIVTFGKHKGSRLYDVPWSYLLWGAEKLNSRKWRERFKQEVERREGVKENTTQSQKVAPPPSGRVTVIGKVFKVDLKKTPKPSYYNQNIEKYDVKLNVGLVTEDGMTYYFYSPATEMRISLGPGFALVRGDNSDWIKFSSGAAKAGIDNDLGPESRIHIGDEIGITGKIKKVSHYITLYYVKLHSVEQQPDNRDPN